MPCAGDKPGCMHCSQPVQSSKNSSSGSPAGPAAAHENVTRRLHCKCDKWGRRRPQGSSLQICGLLMGEHLCGCVEGHRRKVAERFLNLHSSLVQGQRRGNNSVINAESLFGVFGRWGCWTGSCQNNILLPLVIIKIPMLALFMLIINVANSVV